jgi:hypothetical protein
LKLAFEKGALAQEIRALSEKLAISAKIELLKLSSPGFRAI